MLNLKIDKKKCTNCGLCSTVCPVMIIDSKSEFPVIKDGKESNCLKCQHCLAVCPEAALSILGMGPEGSISVTDQIPGLAEMENLMKTRRSIRKFRNDEIDNDMIQRLITSASYSPTAKNENGVQFTVVDNREDMLKFREIFYDHIGRASDKGRIDDSRAALGNFQKLWQNKKIDIVFRDAPHLLITSAPKDCTFPETDCAIAMTYFELLANSNEIGTIWDGFAQWGIEDIAPELKEVLGIPENHYVAAVILFGKSGVKYARSIQNDNPMIKTVNL